MDPKQQFQPVCQSLAELLGKDYTNAVAQARSFLAGSQTNNKLTAPPVPHEIPAEDFQRLAEEPVDFFPQNFFASLNNLLPRTGDTVAPPSPEFSRGASTLKFNTATYTAHAPLSGLGWYRISESGRLHFTAKSEHYHAPLGHGFPGYRLIDTARRLGIPNATHNNTRGHITRLLEEELVRTANGIAPSDRAALDAVLSSTQPGVLNRVLNLETGSLAVEAAIKMMLARFYRMQEDSPEPPFSGRTPVFVVVGNDEGQLHANYHGTTVIAQTMRGMWPAFAERLDTARLMKVVPVRPNNIGYLDRVFREYERGSYKIAGFIHEIVMMNYGARLLSREFLEYAYRLCRESGTPALDDEIQTCLWNPDLYMFLEYGLKPSFVAVGKGFPGGEFPASRIIFSSDFDCMPQFGALVTNGQEELASLAYLITMRWAAENAGVTRAVGEYYNNELRKIARQHSAHVAGIEGYLHLSAICFRSLDTARRFVKIMSAGGIDISVQVYKADCPPAALTKIPLIAGYEAADMMLKRTADALSNI